MTPENAVTASPLLALLAFGGVVALLLVLIARWRWHVFAALLLPLLIFGILPGIDSQRFIAAFETGFGNTLGSIGVVIVLGCVLGEVLRHTGAIETVTRTMISVVGAARMPLALTATGFVLGIVIFSDVAFVIVNPLIHGAARAMNVTIGVMSIGLVGALQLTHAIVPPTPGPLAAAALVGADIGRVIVFGSLASGVGAVACWLWGQYLVGPRLPTPPSDDFAVDLDARENSAAPPGALASYAPIVLPVLLISAQSIAQMVFEEGHALRALLAYIGWPVCALSVGVWLALRNARSPAQREAARSAWIEEALKVSAMILVVTGLGGSLSEILKGTPAVAAISGFFVAYGLPAILLPFVIGVVSNMITGSTTVGVITAASIVAPMLGPLALSPEAAMLAAASGSVIIKYVNSSYFWVCTSLTRMPVTHAILGFGGATLVGGIASFAAVWGMHAAGWL